MKIVIFTIGTEGDVRPLVALALGLRQAGHQVRIATDPSCADLVRENDIDYACLNGDFLAWMRSDQRTMERGLASFTIMAEARRRLLAMAVDWAEQGRTAAQGADLLIGNGMVYYLAASLGERLGMPVVESQLMPTLPSSTSPPLPLPQWMYRLPGFANKALGHAARLLVWKTLKPAYNEIVRPALGLPAYPRFAPFQAQFLNHPRLFGFSPILIEPSASWPEQTRVTGHWYLENREKWRPPEALMQFLESGPPPIYVGFGSMMHHDAAGFTDKVLGAVKMTGKRAVLATGWGGLSEKADFDTSTVFALERAPHDWLLPRMALAVHHAGAGTTAAAARAGIPSVVTPVFGDQPFWAARLEHLGVAPKALPREKLTATSLASAILDADAPHMCEAARKLGEKLRAEHGIESAIDALRAWGLLPSPTAVLQSGNRLKSA
ncbi:glycosyltransferase [Rhizobium sp. ICMP 5592]|uniref:glycosyltransferase n=1 Tax=Rhizobium sp. ICMP 5592 TaxID=2292445 RepID=UPI001297459D|nr:glycosyltransferase [Rhizobium sp. ICMP 5592]MQB44700.1 glycosyltransferase [Rhizobium sp. ICMP 5592]